MNFKKYFEKANEAGITSSELTSSTSTSFSFSLFKGELVSYNIDTSRRLSSRGIYEGKMGFGTTENDSADSADFLINAIKLTASLNESDDEPIIYEGGTSYKKFTLNSKNLKARKTEEKIKICKEIEQKLQNYDSRISDVEVYYSDNYSERILANSFGLNLKETNNYFVISASVVIKDGEEIKSNYDSYFGVNPEEFNIDEFCKNIVEKGLGKLHGESIKAGKYKAVFSRESVSALLNALLSNVSSEQIQKHSSRLEGKLNTKVLSDKLTVYEKPHLRNIFYTYFDDEGVATQDKVIFEKGVLKTYFYNLVTAKKDGVETTGNASRRGNKMGITFGNITVKNGRLSEEELFKKIKNGVYITDVSGLHAGLDSTSGDFSLQAEGFHVENGVKSKPLTLFTVSGNIFELFNDIIAVGNNSKLLINSTTTPSIAFKNLKISAE